MKRLWALFLTLPLLLGGCKQINKQLRMPSSRVRKIAHLDATTNDFEMTKEGITIRSRTITSAQECSDLFGRNGKDLLDKRKKIYPIQITIENKSDKTLVLPRENVGLKTASIRRVLKRVGYWTGMRTLLTGGCLFGGVTILTWVSSPLAPIIVYGPPALASAAICTGAPFFLALGILIPAVPLLTMLHSIKSHNANSMISKFVKKSCVIEQVTIEPGQTRSLLFFVRPRFYKRNFSMVFKQGDKNAILFDIRTISIKPNLTKKNDKLQKTPIAIQPVESALQTKTVSDKEKKANPPQPRTVDTKKPGEPTAEPSKKIIEQQKVIPKKVRRPHIELRSPHPS